MSEIIPILSFLRVAEEWTSKARPFNRAFLWLVSDLCGMLPAHHKELAMSLYSDLQQRYESRESAIQGQLYLLSKAAGELASGFGKYLGVPSDKWNHPDGKAGERYVRLGEGSASAFKEKRWVELSSLKGKVDFSIALTLVSEDRASRVTYVFELGVQFTEFGYLFEVNGRGVPLTVEDVKAGDFEPVYSQIVEQLLARLDKSDILIKN
ncbi:hypothetical protein [Pseudomonas sp. CM25]|uniref:hypothetical protein n=1 Tax=Pseudomonas sp. CM25 TaxID=2738448 RepID=UPI001556C60E|nr:hypothetical protein [Pseudomonas sp. CM25]